MIFALLGSLGFTYANKHMLTKNKLKVSSVTVPKSNNGFSIQKNTINNVGVNNIGVASARNKLAPIGGSSKGIRQPSYPIRWQPRWPPVRYRDLNCTGCEGSDTCSGVLNVGDSYMAGDFNITFRSYPDSFTHRIERLLDFRFPNDFYYNPGSEIFFIGSPVSNFEDDFIRIGLPMPIENSRATRYVVWPHVCDIDEAGSRLCMRIDCDVYEVVGHMGHRIPELDFSDCKLCYDYSDLSDPTIRGVYGFAETSHNMTRYVDTCVLSDGTEIDSCSGSDCYVKHYGCGDHGRVTEHTSECDFCSGGVCYT